MATFWQHSESFADTNFKMLENLALCDVTLLAGNDQKQIKCHRFILASRSPVFYAMFCGTLAESKDSVCVPDIEPSTLENLLRYLYRGKVEINADTALSLLYASKKYDIPGLESECKLFVTDTIDAENVCSILDQAKMLDDNDLKEKSLNFIMEKSQSVLKSEAFVQMSKSGLEAVLKLETFSASECDLYLGCKRWAAQKCRDAGKQETHEHIRQELGDELVGLIRFPSMTSEVFTDLVACENVLNKDEIILVYRSISKKLNVSSFNCTERKNTHDKCLFIRCIKIGRPWSFYPFQNDGLSFTVSSDCQFIAVDLFLPMAEGSLSGVVELLEESTAIPTQNVTLNYNKGIEHELVNLDPCVHIFTGKVYSIRQRMKGTNGFKCDECTNSITVKGVSMSFTNLKVGSSDNGTSVSSGQFYGFELLIKTTK